MKFLNVDMELKNIPELDKNYIPLSRFIEAFLKTAKKPISIAIERNENSISRFDTYIHGTEEMKEADKFYIERIVKFLLWAKGGHKIYIGGDKNIAEFIKNEYSKDGKRAFDNKFMEKIYENKFEVISEEIKNMPEEKESSKSVGRHLEGCRIGFDAGGSDRKVSAVVDGKTIYSEETVWFPKTNSDPQYHYNGILESLKKAASKMPRVDAIGVSSAGVYVDNKTMVASLFIKVPENIFDKKVKDIYIRAAKELGENIPIEVANDGDVTALAGAMSLKDNAILGIAMGTSQAAGFVNENGNITGWLNEFAFCPVDANIQAMKDEWSGDIGCGVKYFSQDAVIKLASNTNLELDEKLSPAEKLKVVQKLVEENDERAIKIYECIGYYLAYSIALYDMFYKIKHILLLGRVMSGKGGDIILNTAKRILEEEYPQIAKQINVQTPDEKARRVGQSVAAASLPEINY